MIFPGSASGPKEFLEFHPAGVMHDVHGPWHYVPDEHYALFNHSDSLFHGELGAEGMACRESLARFLPEKDLMLTNMQENLTWRHHGDWWDTWFRDLPLVGELPDLDTMIRVSQYFQFEGLRYALASNRRRQFRNSGSLMWAYHEPYPNVSNTSLADYYGVPKLGWYAAREAYAALLMSLRYDRPIAVPGKPLAAEAWLTGDPDHEQMIPWTISIHAPSGHTLCEAHGETLLPADGSVAVNLPELIIPEDAPDLLIIRLTYDKDRVSEYLFSTRKETPFAALLRLKTSLRWEELPDEAGSGNGCEIRAYRVTATGTNAALLIVPELDGDSPFLQSMDGCPCLLPGETKIIRVSSFAAGKDWSKLRFRCVNPISD